MIDHAYGVSLGEIEYDNLDMYKRWRNDPSIRSWCRQTGLLTDQDQEGWYERIHKDPTIQMFEIRRNTDEKCLGVCGLTSIDRQNRSAEFSLYVCPDEMGKGYGEKTLKTLLHFGFSDLGLNRIWGETFEGNPALALFRKLGMVEEGRFSQSYWKKGRFIDSHIVAMTYDMFVACLDRYDRN